jgi:MFS family permease
MRTKNISILNGLKFLEGLVFFLPVLALYFEQELFSLTNVALIFAVGALAQTIMEVPTGAIADLFGRRNSYILSKISGIVALVFLFVGGNLWMFLAYAVVDAFAKSLKSGTDTAIMYDSLKDGGQDDLFKKVSGKASAISHMGIALGSIASGYLAAVSLSLPVVLTFIPAGLALFLSLFLVEPTYEKEGHTILSHLKSAGKFVLQSKQILLIVAGMFVIAAVFDSMVALTPIWFRFKQIPIEGYGWISAVIFGLAAVGYQQSHKFAKIFGDKKAIMLTTITPPITIFIATLLDKWLAVFFTILSPLFFGLRTPILDHLIHQEVGSSKRATIYSITELVKKMALAIFAPFAGYLADLFSINVAFQMFAGMLLLVPLIYYFLES